MRADSSRPAVPVVPPVVVDVDTSPAAVARRRDDAKLRGRNRQRKLLAEPVAAAVPRPDVSGLAAEPSPRSGRSKSVPDVQHFLAASWVQIDSPPEGNTGGRLASDPIRCIQSEKNEPIPLAGFKGHTLHLDWANWTFPVQPEGYAGDTPTPNVDAVQALVSDFLGEQPEERLTGWHGYKCGREWRDGGKIAWTPGRGEAWLSLNGDTLACIPPARQLDFFRGLWALNVVRATRLDPAFDDFARSVALDTVEAAVNVRNYTGTGRDAFERRQIRNPRKGTLRSDSCIFGLRGSAGSGIMLRVYDKKLEMIAKGCPEDHALDCIRWEPEYTDEKATELWRRIAACADVKEFARVLGAAVTNAIDFIDRESVPEASRHCVSRMKRLAWWSELCALLTEGPIIHVKRLISTLCQAATACRKQWGKFFALLNVALQSSGDAYGVGNIVQQWSEANEPHICWEKQRGRDLSVSLPLILAT